MNVLRNQHVYGKDIHSDQASGYRFTDIRRLEPANVIMYLVATLLVIGIIMIYSTSSAKVADSALTMNTTFIRHVMWVAIAIIGMLIMMRVDYHYLQKYRTVIFIIALAGLVVVLIPAIGTVTYGARRWIRVGTLGYQPSEFAKLAMVIFISGYITKNREKMSTFARGFVVPIILIGIVSLLILKEPDFGTAMFISMISFILIMTGGTRIVYVIFTLIASIPHIYQIMHNIPTYRHNRLLAFLDPWKDPSGIGYQIIQSWIALGSGGVAGLGMGESRQKLFFLPMSGNDFVFSIIGEEFGFIGTTSVVVMFALLTWQGIRVCKATSDPFGFFLSLGITISLALQAAINIAVVTGSIPTKGLPLPFISTGGSSILLSMLGIGILLNIAKQSGGTDASASSIEKDRSFAT
ncbi:MAG: putative lipid II flippase FtsW [Candidatus Scalindua sp.]|jgi:cell division protein FtsW|nr:putative lipid II flippase FtsW [Candidatus Scalindua sp.]MBT5307550.1 putative lipid II flippase FtsW [Candidatus Scalindua sp.]MBT6049224.1 putative lipid II flippase FtsW [Candidatus Scalindua sp.]MBT6225519.1 putative lipid II flippase FtsW [Candidatus Scalindua sp.]MBT6565205.1 putative lipid II flippase FtsW [Candidatus Scalindua sp.]